MAPFLFLLLLQAGYEEDPAATQKLREGLWRQADAFATRLEQDPASLERLLKTRLGFPPPGLTGKVTLRLEKTGEDAAGVYHRAWFRVGPELDLYGLYIVPKKVKGRRPLVISQHGGGGFPEMATFQGGSNYHDMVRGAVQEGYVVFAPLITMYPFGDRDRGTAIPADVRAQMDAKLRAAGTSFIGLEIGKLQRALDVLLTRKEIDPRRVGMVGLSYGGFYTLYMAALDARITAAVASCSFRDELPKDAHPPAGRPVDLLDWQMARIIAPRALQVQSGVKDKLLPIASARAAAARLKGQAGFVFEEFDGAHEFRGALAWPFLRQHLQPGR